MKRLFAMLRPGTNVGWVAQHEAQVKPLGFILFSPTYLAGGFGFMNLPFVSKQAFRGFPQFCLETQADKPASMPTLERRNKATRAIGVGLLLMLCNACQPAFIGIDSEADVAAENCYAYRYGDKLRQINFAQAFDWCYRSARFGNAHSQTLLGELYYLGLGGAQDWLQAAHWFETAAKQGHAHAQYMLYRIYSVSNDVAEQVQADYWLQQARASGYKLAQ